LGILVGDGMLPHPATEQIIETYYSYALTASTRLTADYQFINNPAYNTDRGQRTFFRGGFTGSFRDVRFGSKADIEARLPNVCFTPKSRTSPSGVAMSALYQKQTFREVEKLACLGRLNAA
jgi:hypothetical protein